MRGSANFRRHLLCCFLFFLIQTGSYWWKECLSHLFSLSVHWFLHTRAALASAKNSFVHLCGIFWVLKDFFLASLQSWVFSIHFPLGQHACKCLFFVPPQLYFLKRKKKSSVNSSVIATAALHGCFSSNTLCSAKIGVNYHRDKMVSKCLRVMESKAETDTF